MKVITCTGFGNSGSSAATDYFSEFDNVQLVPHDFECTFLHEADGLYDLEKAIEEGHRFKVDLAVKRFLALAEKLQKTEYYKYFNDTFFDYTMQFISDSIGVKWNGWWHRSMDLIPDSKFSRYRANAMNYSFQKRVKKMNYELYETDSWMPSYLPVNTMYYDCDVEKFRINAKKYVSKLLRELNPSNKEYLLVDQLLPPVGVEKYLHYFDEIKIVIVDRDPRDYFLCNNLFWGSRYLPTFNIDTFITWFSKTRGLVVENDCVTKILLEDLVYKYEETTEKLRKFVGFSNEHHIHKFKYLNPERSKKNTRLFIKYTNYANEIVRIENSLIQYLFDYSSVNALMLENESDAISIEPIRDLLLLCDEQYLERKFSIYTYFWGGARLFYHMIKFPWKFIKKIISKCK